MIVGRNFKPNARKEFILLRLLGGILKGNYEEKKVYSCTWKDFSDGESVKQLECEHCFHSGCIVPWLELHGTCPVCRKELGRTATAPGKPVLLNVIYNGNTRSCKNGILLWGLGSQNIFNGRKETLIGDLMRTYFRAFESFFSSKFFQKARIYNKWPIWLISRQ